MLAGGQRKIAKLHTTNFVQLEDEVGVERCFFTRFGLLPRLVDLVTQGQCCGTGVVNIEDSSRYGNNHPQAIIIQSGRQRHRWITPLRTDTGEVCGTAMASIVHTGGELSGSRIYHVSPALAQAIDETGEPALHRILPAIITDALAPTDQIPPDSLTPGSGDTVAQP